MPVSALVVDDSAAARQIVAYHLSHAGCTIVGQAGDASDALRLFRELKTNIVTLDLMMPVREGIDSLTLVRMIKKEAPHTAIVVISVIPSEKVRQDFIDEGVFAYLVKPFNDYALKAIGVKLRRTFPELK